MMKMGNEMNVNVPLEIIKASEIEPKEVKWLWYPYIPFGKVTLTEQRSTGGKIYGSSEIQPCPDRLGNSF